MKQLNKIYLIHALNSSWFVSAVFYFYQRRLASDSIVAMIFAVAFFGGFIAEIPTGYFADKFGRKSSIIFGQVIILFGNLTIIFATNYWYLFVGSTAVQIGIAYMGGAIQAIAAESTTEYSHKHINTQLMKINAAFVMLTMVAGAGLYKIEVHVPYIARAVTIIIAMIITFTLKETKHTTNLSKQNKYNLLEFKNVFKINKKEYLYSLLVGSILISFQLGPLSFAVVVFNDYAVLGMTLVAGLRLLLAFFLYHKISIKMKTSTYSVLTMLILGIVFKPFMLIVVLLCGGLSAIVDPTIIGNISEHTPKKLRATAISINSVMAKLILAITLFPFGILMEHKEFILIYLIFALMALFWLVYSYLSDRKK